MIFIRPTQFWGFNSDLSYTKYYQNQISLFHLSSTGKCTTTSKRMGKSVFQQTLSLTLIIYFDTDCPAWRQKCEYDQAKDCWRRFKKTKKKQLTSAKPTCKGSSAQYKMAYLFISNFISIFKLPLWVVWRSEALFVIGNPVAKLRWSQCSNATLLLVTYNWWDLMMGMRYRDDSSLPHFAAV